MTLLELLRQELPKRGGWPEGANCITQDGDLKVEPATCHPSVAKCGEDGFWFLDSSRIGGFEVDTLASDYTTAIITRDQYETVLAAKNDGWIEWGGGKSPVDNATTVDIKFRAGAIVSGVEAGKYYWPQTGHEYDIIAYRLHQPQKEGQPETSEEDINDCIGQAPVAEWNGEGLPPVGCECEFMKHTLDTVPNWRRGIIKYVSEYTVVIIEALSPGEFVAHPRTCNFRPLRTEAERAIDEMVRLSGVSIGAAKILYDAGYRK